MDQTNPLSEITHKRRLSALGPGGLSRIGQALKFVTFTRLTMAEYAGGNAGGAKYRLD